MIPPSSFATCFLALLFRAAQEIRSYKHSPKSCAKHIASKKTFTSHLGKLVLTIIMTSPLVSTSFEMRLHILKSGYSSKSSRTVNRRMNSKYYDQPQVVARGLEGYSHRE